ncbi:MAG: 2-hydroxyacyl-CoA dehydratase [Synergistaceae bacterium]|nr:2-hydroxyacyl-CoA dehydratase [Synergistaceae bacterium]
MSLASLFEYLENLRRDAYVRAVMRASESDDVLGFIGSRLPVEIFHAMDLYAIPVYGVDGEILKFSREKNLCPVVDATVTYAKTDKCPLIHSSKLIVVENSCPIMTREIMKLDKNIYIYESESELVKKLSQVYHRELDSEKLRTAQESLQKIAELITRIKYYSDLTGLQVYILEFYLNFLELNERINILQELSNQIQINFSDHEINYVPVRVQSGAGIYKQIDKLLAGRNYRILEDFCRVDSKNLDYVYEHCPYYQGERINY